MLKIKISLVQINAHMKVKLTGLIMALPFLGFAQANFKPGYRVTNQLDTVKGYIDYKERTLTPTTFIFKDQLAGAAQQYSLANTSAYGIIDAEHFRRHVVKISMGTVDLQHISTGLDSSSRTDTVFLKVIQDGGNLSLYAYEDIVKKRFFIQQGTKTPVELQRHVFYSLEDKSMAVTSAKYRNQLQAINNELHPGEEMNDRKWASLKYMEPDLKKAVAAISGQQVLRSKHVSSRIFAGTGINIARARYQGANPLSGDNASNKNAMLPFLTFGVDYFANPAVRKLIYRLEIGVSAANYEVKNQEVVKSTIVTETADIVHSFDQVSAHFTPQIIYNIYNGEKRQFYISGGIAFNLSAYQNSVQTKDYTNSYYGNRTVVTEDPIEFRSFSFAVRTGAGLVLNKKVEIALGYSFPSAITDYLYQSIDVQRISVGVNYIFGKK